jgi:hypothetical protein
MPSKRDYRIFFIEQFWFAAAVTFLPAWFLCDVFLHINIFSTGLLVWLGMAAFMFVIGLDRAVWPKDPDQHSAAQPASKASGTAAAGPSFPSAALVPVSPADEGQALVTEAIVLAQRWIESGRVVKARCDHCGHSEDVGVDWLSHYFSQHLAGSCRDCLRPLKLHYEEPQPHWDPRCMDDLESLELAVPAPRHLE